MQVIQASYLGVSQPLRLLTPITSDPKTPSILAGLQDRLIIPKTQNASDEGFDRTIVQESLGKVSMPAPIVNFEGVNNVNGVLPPDTQGDIGTDPATGKKYYVQWVNLSFRIWDVTNPAAIVSVYGPAAGNTLWAGTGTICASHNDGDPITQFDHLADRWMMSQFALSNPNNYHQCIAVSATADPTGVWYRYDFQTSTVDMNDYPKFGVWPDGYYMTVNQFKNGASWAGAGVAVFERTAMLAGLPARMIYIDTGTVTLNYGGMLPSDLDGPAPAAGTPNYFMEWDDSTWIGDPADTLRIWEFKTNWAVPANTTFGLNTSYDPNLKITTANVDPNLCSSPSICIPQPDTAQKLDAIADRLMYRLQYRDFGTYQTLVSNHTVDATGADKAGIHWFELRNTGAGFAMYQQGVYAPDADNRWMGSVAMDASGNIALGYSVSSSTTYPSIRYTGRLAADPANTLPQGETSLMVGTGSQTHSAARWGDYSMMAVDDSDGCTFWYTQEYIQTTGSAPWQTRVASFKFPTCTTAPTGTLSGTVTDVTAAPLVGANIDVSGGYTTLTDAVGHYALTLEAGTYSVTASKYGYVSNTVPGVLVTPPGTTTQDFTLTAAPTSTISGVVTDAATGWPLYARLDIFGFSSSPVFTDPVTGAYSVPLVDGPYTFTVSAMSGGYTPTIMPLVVSANATLNFALAVDSIACTAPGYQLIPGIVLSSDGFDTSTAPAFSANWAVVDVSGTTGDWITRLASVHPTGITPHSTPNMAVFNSWTTVSGQTRLYQTSGNDLSAQPSGEISFWMFHESGYTSADTVQVQVSTNSGVNWNNVGIPIARYDGTTGWAKHTVNINAYTGVGMTNVRIGFLGISAYGNDIHVDDMAISTAAQCNPIPTSGLVIGSVFDANTSLLVLNASVKDAALQSALLIDNSDDPATPAQMYVIAQHSGTQALTASTLKYTSSTQSPLVVAGGTVRQDFYLAAGMLTANPTNLAFEVSAAALTTSKPLTLSNSGSALATYEVFAIPGSFIGYTPTGPFADHTRHFGPKNLNDLDASKIRVDLTPQNVPMINGGTVSASWPTGLTYAWGIGFNTDATDLWLGNIGEGGGDDLDYRFTTAGVNTGDTISTLPWVSVFGGDMTYNPFTHMLWQVNIGGDNCIYELDPATKTSTGNKICPAFGTSERGLTFDPLTNTYYAGSWNDGIINHFATDGTIIDSAAVNLNISGLAFNPSTGHLFAMTNNNHPAGVFDVYVLDTKNAYNILGAFNIKDGSVDVFATGGQAGLEMDCSGNLWAVHQVTQKVYVADSGETGICNWHASWLSTIPITGSVAGPGSAPLTANVDATGMVIGTYPAYLRVVSNTPYNDEIVPVTLNVINAAPVADAQSVTTDDNTAKAIMLAATDANGDTLTYSVVAAPSHGILTGSAPALIYTPAVDYHGFDSFTFKANDGTADSNIATVSITVTQTHFVVFIPLVKR
jgi:hypothetical protein